MGPREASKPGVYMKVVYFCVSAPNMHWAKVASVAEADSARSRMTGKSHRGP